MVTVVYSINYQRVQINYHSRVRANRNYSPVVSSVPPEVSSNLRIVADIFNSCASVAIQLFRAIQRTHANHPSLAKVSWEKYTMQGWQLLQSGRTPNLSL